MNKIKYTNLEKSFEEWAKKSISQISDIYLGGTPKTSVNEYWDGDVFWASAKDISNCKSRYIETTERTITKEGVENSAAKILPKNTIVITSRGTVGKVALLPFPMAFNQTCYGLLAKKGVDALFLFYRIKSLLGSIDSLSYGTVFDTITKKTFDELTCSFPEIEEQQAIAKILSDLDSKIELNNQMNKTLESIAQAIFKHWFIDFEFPDEDGKPYKSSGGEMVDSELGRIPKGWEVGRLSKIADITMGTSPPGDTYNEIGEGLPFFQGRRDFGFRYPSSRIFCTAPKRIAEADDILFTVRAPVGDLNRALVKCAIGRGVASIRGKNNTNSYIYYQLNATIKEWKSFDSAGTVFGAVNKDDVNNFKVNIPTKDVIIKFNEFAKGIDMKIKENIVESQNLSDIRDSLLPRLMSGKLRIKKVAVA